MAAKRPRRQLILEALAAELEAKPGARITTAAVARAAGLSEAALYRHFASKAQMLEGLIEFAEESVFLRINQILAEERSTRVRCCPSDLPVAGVRRPQPRDHPGSVGRCFGRRDGTPAGSGGSVLRPHRDPAQADPARGGTAAGCVGLCPADAAANLMLAWVEGRMHQYLRSRFRCPRYINGSSSGTLWRAACSRRRAHATPMLDRCARIPGQPPGPRRAWLGLPGTHPSVSQRIAAPWRTCIRRPPWRR